MLDVSILAPDIEPIKLNFLAYEQALQVSNPEASAAFGDVARSLKSEHKQVNYFSTSFMCEPNQWSFITELTKFDHEDSNFSNDAYGYYISAAYQFGDFTPYVTFGEFHNDFADGIPNKLNGTEALIPVGADTTLDGLRSYTKELLNGYDNDQESIVLGFRYDFHIQANFKFEVEYFNFVNNT